MGANSTSMKPQDSWLEHTWHADLDTHCKNEASCLGFSLIQVARMKQYIASKRIAWMMHHIGSISMRTLVTMNCGDTCSIQRECCILLYYIWVISLRIAGIMHYMDMHCKNEALSVLYKWNGALYMYDLDAHCKNDDDFSYMRIVSIHACFLGTHGKLLCNVKKSNAEPDITSSLPSKREVSPGVHFSAVPRLFACMCWLQEQQRGQRPKIS